MVEIFNFPDTPDRNWRRHIGTKLRAATIARTGSASIADAVEARCRAALEACDAHISVDADTIDGVKEQCNQTIALIAGVMLAELGLAVEEIELLKQQQSN